MMRPPERHPVADFCDSYGLLLRRDAVLSGIDDNALRRLVDGRVLIRMRQGAYCLRSVFLAADEPERHRLLCRAVMRQYGQHVALSHASSCLIQGGPEFGIRLNDVHLTHVTGGGRHNSRLDHHQGACTVVDLRLQDRLLVTVPARAALEVACTEGAEAGLVQANHFLHTGAATVEELQDHAARAAQWPGSIAHHTVLLLADPRIESVGETRSDLLFWRMGLPRPVPQFEVSTPAGEVVARVDFAWPEQRVIVEFDGRQKYHRFRKPGETIEQMVEREKAREDLIRELTGWIVIRLTWAELELPEHTAARIRRAMRPVAS